MRAIVREVTYTWLCLVVLTGISLYLGEGSSADGPSRWVPFAVVVLACVKIRIVILRFMEVQDAPWLLRGALELWVVGVGCMLIVMYGG